MAATKRIRPYKQPAGGWGAQKALGEHLVEQGIALKGSRTLLRMNQPMGFDCPGCVWPDPRHTSSFEFCEIGGKAVAWESTAERCTPPFFAEHTISELEEELVADYDRIRDAIENVFPIFQDFNVCIRLSGGFHLVSTARERLWNTGSGKANFLTYDGVREDPVQKDSDVLWLTSMRSHDQYNTTLYSMSAPYRGVYGQRDVVFLSATEMEKRGFEPGDRVDVVAANGGGIERHVRGYQLVACSFPEGSCAAYYHETSPLVALDAHDPMSFTPSYKGIPVRLVRAATDAA